MDRSVNSFLEEIDARLRKLESRLPQQIDPFSSPSKLPFKALAYQATLIWRITELGRVAFNNFNASKLAAAILLTRASFETTAALWYCQGKISAAVNAKALGEIDGILMKLSFGTRNWTEDFPKAIHVNDFLHSIDKTVVGFRKQYDTLCEYAHPNYMGTSGLYLEHNADKIANFGTRNTEASKCSGVVGLSVALMIFEHTYNAMSDLMPEFVSLCEKNLAER